jgi:hypothetical protein
MMTENRKKNILKRRQEFLDKGWSNEFEISGNIGIENVAENLNRCETKKVRGFFMPKSGQFYDSNITWFNMNVQGFNLIELKNLALEITGHNCQYIANYNGMLIAGMIMVLLTLPEEEIKSKMVLRRLSK